MPELTPVEGRRDDGFTLIEMLVVVVIMGVIGGIFFSTVVNAARVDDATRSRADAQEAVTLALERVTKEVRVAAPLVSVSPTSVVVDVYPTQPSGSTLRERHTFTLTGTELQQQVQVFSPATSTIANSTSTRVLADGVVAAGTAFTAKDRAGAATTLPSKVASLDISLQRGTATAKPFVAATTIFLRNYKG